MIVAALANGSVASGALGDFSHSGPANFVSESGAIWCGATVATSVLQEAGNMSNKTQQRNFAKPRQRSRDLVRVEDRVTDASPAADFNARPTCLLPGEASPLESSIRERSAPRRASLGLQSPASLPKPPNLPSVDVSADDVFQALLDQNIACEPASPDQSLDLTPVDAVLKALLVGE